MNYYEILEIDTSANEREVKSAFRKLAKKYHPDVNQDAGAQDAFKRVYMAYEVLSDPYKKRLYDELRSGAESSSESVSYEEDEFDYNSGFNDWERRASHRADYYANMRYEQFREEELQGMDFIYHQIALFLGVIALFGIGLGALYFGKTIITASLADKVPPISLLGALVCIVFGIIVLRQGIKISRVFTDGILGKFKKKK